MPAPAATDSPSVRTWSGWPVPLLVAILAWAVNQVVPLASALIIALAVGAVVANTALLSTPVLGGSARAATLMLRLGVALLGLRLAVSDLTQLGLLGVVVVLATVACTYVVTLRVGTRMGLDPGFVSLIASGFAVCGAAAIAAVQDSVKARESVVGQALALITIHGTVMLAVIPVAGRLLGLDEQTVSVWAGASIHEVAQVAAAAALIGPGALVIAMGIKLGRVLMLAPVHHAVSRRHHGGHASLLREIPWFLHAFVAAVLLRATGILPESVLTAGAHTSTVLLAAGMFGLGLGIVLKDLWPVPVRAVVLSGVATLIVTTVPLVILLVCNGA